ncbi:MAG: MFS transporter, partial [Actinomycetota bacterium]
MPEPVATEPTSGGQRVLLPTVLVFTMMASSYQIFAFAVLAVPIIDDLGISRTALGFLAALNTLVGALSAPTTGRITDRIGARLATVIVLTLSGMGMALMAVSTNWMVLAGSALVSGIP